VFYPKVDGRVTCKRRRKIDFHQPWLEILVNKNIIAQQLKARGARRHLLELSLNMAINRHQALEYQIVDSGPQQIAINAHLVEMLRQST
jgi:hypothetical protein